MSSYCSLRIHNELKMQYTADATELNVVACSKEGTIASNISVQAE